MLGGSYSNDKDNVMSPIRMIWIKDPSAERQKSINELSKYCHNSISVSCLNSSHQKLLASIQKLRIFDEFSGEETINAGPLVLTNQSTCFLDDFERLTKASSNHIAESLIHNEWVIRRNFAIKGGMKEDKLQDFVRIPVRCNVLIASGAAKDIIDPSRPLESQMPISENSVMRFDIILPGDNQFGDCIRKKSSSVKPGTTSNGNPKGKRSYDLMTGIEVPAMDYEAFSSIGSRFKVLIEYMEEHDIPCMSPREVSQIISYAREYCFNPDLENDAKDFLAESYLTIRNNANTSNARINLHTLMTLKVLCKARARADLSMNVTVQHVKDVVELFDEHTLLGERKNQINSIAHKMTSITGRRTKGKGIGSLLPGFNRALISISGKYKDGLIPLNEVTKIAETIIQMKGSLINSVDLINAANHEGFILKSARGYRLG